MDHCFRDRIRKVSQILLGGFHKIMSFFGSIGTIMNESGISAMFQTIYGENATDQATKLGINTPSITFDQQLWIIALEIVLEKSLKYC